MITKIFVMTHKKFQVPKESIYIPLQVGREIHEDLGYTGDNTGKNISSKNQYYSELTGLYWAAENVKDADYMGLCHYRRYFLNADGNLFTKNDFEEVLSSHDVILPRVIRYEKSYYEVYNEAHHIEDLMITGEAIKKLYPKDYAVFEKTIHGNKVYCGNLFATRRELFIDYKNWLFSIFEEVEPRLKVESYDAYHKRVYGFLSEQLLYVWVQIRGLDIYEAPVGLTQEKAETMELKQLLKEKVAIGNLEGVTEALEMFRSHMKERPDLMLQGSDLSGELKDMFRVIYILEAELTGYEANAETAYGITVDKKKYSMLNISSDLNILLKHFKLVTCIAENIAEHKATKEEISYLRDAHVSKTMMHTIIDINPKLQLQSSLLLSYTEI